MRTHRQCGGWLGSILAAVVPLTLVWWTAVLASSTTTTTNASLSIAIPSNLSLFAATIGRGGGAVRMDDTCPESPTALPGEWPTNDENAAVEAILADLNRKYAHQPLFLQAVSEMALSIRDLLLVGPAATATVEQKSNLYSAAFAMLTEPERTISFRVPWMDDRGHMQCNRAWRVEFCR